MIPEEIQKLVIWAIASMFAAIAMSDISLELQVIFLGKGETFLSELLMAVNGLLCTVILIVTLYRIVCK